MTLIIFEMINEIDIFSKMVNRIFSGNKHLSNGISSVEDARKGVPFNLTMFLNFTVAVFTT